MAKKSRRKAPRVESTLPARSEKKRLIGAALALSLVTCLLFAPTIGYDFVLWDDNKLVSENPAMHPLDLHFIYYAFTNVGISVWYPLTLISLSLDYTLFGEGPFGFHLTNVLLHGANAFLFTLLSYRLFDIIRRRQGRSTENRMLLAGALFSGLLFALHPLRIESVAWVTERKDVLSGLFIFLTLLAYLSYGSAPKEGRSRYYTAAIIFYVLALLSKPIAVTLPVVLLILDFYPLKRLGQKELYRTVLEKVPFFALAGAVAVITLVTGSREAETSHFIPASIRLYNSCYAYLFYPVKMAFPIRLAPFYPLPETTLFSPGYFSIILLFLALTGAAAALWKRAPSLTAVWFSYVIFLFPVVGLVTYGEFVVANRYSYLALLGFNLLIGYAAIVATEKLYPLGRPSILLATGSAVACLCIIGTVREMPAWKDSITLWSREISLYPQVALAYNNRGIAWRRMGEDSRAMKDYSKAISIDPGFFRPHYNLGKLYMEKGLLDEAIRSYTRSIEVNPQYADSYNNRGLTLKKKGDLPGALRDFDKAIQLFPRYAGAYNNRANILKLTGKREAALEDYAKAVTLDPNYAEAYYNWANLLANQGRADEAKKYYTRTITLSPGLWQPFFNRGNLNLMRGDFEAAIADYRQAIARQPKEASLHYALATACGRQGDGACETAHMEKAAALGHKQARQTLKKRHGH